MSYEKIESEHYYHIYNQGNNGENIYKEEINYDYFLKLMERHIIPIAHVLSYCLLKNHFHLLIKTKKVQEEKKISQAFSNLFNAYAKAINKKYKRTGSLFRSRFKRIKVSNEDYLKQLVVYINLNPVYHGFTNNAFTYKHSSLLLLLSYKNSMLEKEEIWELFDDKKNFQYYINTKKLEFDRKMMMLILE